MRRTLILILLAAAGFGPASEAMASDYRLASNQRISCGRGLSPGRLQTSSCRSYAYVFNVKTSEFFRCAAGLTVTKDNKDLMKIDTEGACQKKDRIFKEDSVYAFDASETEGTNTNSLFGPGGYSIWVLDENRLRARACFTIALGGNQADVSRCVDLKLE